MNITTFFIRRTITTTLLMAAISVFGIIAYFGLPVSDLPAIDFPTISVNVGQPGASPETMANTVATPLEREFTSLQGISSISSTSSIGSTRITLQFDLSRNIDAAAQDVQAAISAASRDLPQTLPRPPSFRKVNPADSPILFLGVSSDTLPMSEVDEYGQVNIAQQISTVNGVAQVDVFGSQKYAVRVQVDPDALASRGIGIDEVRQALASGNSNLPGGTIQGASTAYTIKSNGQLTSADQFRPLIVTYRNGRPVRLAEIARVMDSVENVRSAGWFNGKRSVILAVQRQPGSNTVEIVDGIKKLLPSLQAQMPAGMELGILYDRSQSIRESINDVKETLLIAIALVILVIFVFLRNISATIIPSLAVPDLDTRHVRRDEHAELHARQPFGHGSHAVGRVRCRRCDRRSGKRSPASRNGQRQNAGGHRWIEGNQLHHHFDDGVAGCRLHTRVVHGRHRRPLAARVCGRDLGRDPCVGRCFADADADAHPAASCTTTVAARSTASSTSGRSVSSTKFSVSMKPRCTGPCVGSLSPSWFHSSYSARRRTASWSSPRASSRRKIPAS